MRNVIAALRAPPTLAMSDCEALRCAAGPSEVHIHLRWRIAYKGNSAAGMRYRRQVDHSPAFRTRPAAEAPAAGIRFGEVGQRFRRNTARSFLPGAGGWQSPECQESHPAYGMRKCPPALN
jgi:hypothetical protein